MSSWDSGLPESQMGHKSGFSHILQATRTITAHPQNSVTLSSGHSLSMFSKSVLVVCEPGRRKLKSKNMPAVGSRRLKCIGDALHTQELMTAKIRTDVGFQDSRGHKARDFQIPSQHPGKRPCTADTKTLLKPLFISVTRHGAEYCAPRLEPLSRWHISALPNHHVACQIGETDAAKTSRLCLEKRVLFSLWRSFSTRILEMAARPCPAEASFLPDYDRDSTHVVRKMFLQRPGYARTQVLAS
jgi:hypothetical protein